MLLTRFPNATNVQQQFKELLDAKLKNNIDDQNRILSAFEHNFSKNFQLVPPHLILEFSKLLEWYDDVLKHLQSMFVINGICEDATGPVFTYFQQCFKPLMSETLKMSKFDLEEYKLLLDISLNQLSSDDDN